MSAQNIISSVHRVPSNANKISCIHRQKRACPTTTLSATILPVLHISQISQHASLRVQMPLTEIAERPGPLQPVADSSVFTYRIVSAQLICLSSRTTAKEFLAAAVFYEILSIFGPLETDVSIRHDITSRYTENKFRFPLWAFQVSEKIVYAKWKATAIAKAFREGRQPSPGPANAPPPPSGSAPYENGYAADSSEDVAKQLLGGRNAPFNSEETAAFPSAPEIQIDSLSLPSTSSLNYPSPSMPPLQSRTPPAIPPPTPLVQPPRAPKLAQQPVLPPPLPAPALSIAENWEPAPSTVDPTSIGIAQKHAKWAISALNYEDLETARTELRAALQIIGG